MKRLAILAALLLAGCDDESIPARVAAVQINGFVEAQIECSGPATQTTSPFDTIGITDYRVQKLIDGACLVTGGPWGGYPRLIARSESAAETCRSGSDTTFAKVESGVASFTTNTPSITFEADIESICTGFNLEAFGVE